MAYRESPPAWSQAEPAPAWTQQAPQSSAIDHEQELFRPYSTLDEPVRETILRDVRAVGEKLRVVMMPMDRGVSLSYTQVSQSQDEEELSENDRQMIQSLKDWDLWGPLVLCLGLAVLLSIKAPPNQSSLVFAAVFTAQWAGGTVVTLNAQLLGGTISFFQSLCVLGYSTFPLVLAALVISFFQLFVQTWFWLNLLIVAAGFLWASRVSTVFLNLYMKPERRLLALYPLLFFYTFMGWMILLF